MTQANRSILQGLLTSWNKIQLYTFWQYFLLESAHALLAEKLKAKKKWKLWSLQFNFRSLLKLSQNTISPESQQLTNLYSKYVYPSKTIDYIVVFQSIARKHWLTETTVNTVCSLYAVINSLRASSPFGEVSRSRARAPRDRIDECVGRGKWSPFPPLFATSLLPRAFTLASCHSL